MKTIININQKIATYYSTVMFRLREKLKCEDGNQSVEQAGIIIGVIVVLGVVIAFAIPAFKDTIGPAVLNKLTDMFNLS